MRRPKASCSPARCSRSARASAKPEADSKITSRPPRTRRSIVSSQPAAPGKTSTSAASAVAHHVLHVHARDAGAVDLDPLLGEAGVVDVADVEVQADPGAGHVVEEQLELARAHQEALLGAAVFAADLDPGPGRRFRELLQGLHRARIDLLIR